MRLFVAVRPPAHVLSHLRTALLTVEDAGTVRWTAEENWHLTLAFYGSVPDGAVPEIEAELAAVAERTAPVELHLRGAGEFAHRTLWVGVAGDVDALVRLGASAVAVGEDLLGRRDERVRARPHLTVGRVPAAARRRDPGRPRGRDRHDDRGLGDLVRSLAVYEGPAWTVEDLLLVESRPGEGRGGGPLYTDVGRWGLAATTGPAGPEA